MFQVGIIVLIPVILAQITKKLQLPNIVAYMIAGILLGPSVLNFLTGNLVLALMLGTLAPASAPAGTIAVIEETKSKGSLTHTLYSVVGIDVGLGIVIFGLINPIGLFLISHSANGIDMNGDF